MKQLFFLCLTVLLQGCVTVAVPPTPPAPVSQVHPADGCPIYTPPRRRNIPVEPDIETDSGNYVKDLEELAEKLATYVGVLRDYIDEEHADEDVALSQYQQQCRAL